MKSIGIKDDLKFYNKYTCDYRECGSMRYMDFSKYSPFNIKDIQDYIEDYSWDGNRTELYSSLKKYAGEIGAGASTMANIELIKNDNTYAVVSGHQPSLAGGPLFVLLKIASVISLTCRLNKLNIGKKFVPLFWIASEDHNFAEFNSISFYDKLNDLITHKLDGMYDNAMASSRAPAGESFIGDIIDSLPQTEFLNNIRDELLYASSGDIGRSFSRLISNWFEEYGLITIEPSHLRELSRPVIIESVKKHTIMVDNMNADSAEMLENNYRLQLPEASVDNTFLFYIHAGSRHRIKLINGKYHVSNHDIVFSSDEIIDEINDYPQRFSAVASLRPIIQSKIIPTPFYIAGGGELAYHYQLRRNFRELGASVPMLIPRLAGTFITPSINKLLQKFSIRYDQLLANGFDWDVISESLVKSNATMSNAFESFNSGMNELYSELKSTLQSTSKINITEADREINKFMQRFDKVQTRIMQNSSPAGEDAKKKFFRLFKFILPGGKYQELSVSGLYFYTLLGRDFFDTICKADVLLNDHNLWIFD